MKKIFLILLISAFTLVSCSDDNDNNSDGKGYLTSLENVKSGIVGVWMTRGGKYYFEYKSNGITCTGINLNEVTDYCSKYEIFRRDGKYVIRVYGGGDLEGVGSYEEGEITFLDEYELIIEDDRYIRVR